MSSETDQQVHILLVDDKPENIDILGNVLGGGYQISVATDGEKALSIVRKSHPELVLLDVMMPGMDGFEVCLAIKEMEETQHVDVIFVSALDSKEKIATGYEAGAIDYITKPIDPNEVLRKVERALENRQRHAELLDGHQQALDTAKSAITAVSEQGQVIEFLRKSFSCNSIESLAQNIIQSTQVYGFDCSVQIREGESASSFSGCGFLEPLEIEFLTQAQHVDRLYEKGRLFVANYGGITLLVKNMPADEEKRGRFRDHLAIIAEGAESRLNSISVTKAIDKALDSARFSLQEIQEFQRGNKQSILHTIDELSDKVEASFLSYGLTEEQEKLLEQAVQDTEDRVKASIDKGILVDDRLQAIIARLQACSELSSSEEEALPEDDVELF